jgi:hypothetical protein
MQQDVAETIAWQALGWLAANEELLPIFMGATGTSTDDLRGRAGEPEYLCSVLDFLMMDDAWVIEFCDTQSLPYDQLMIARQSLPGGAQINWT